MPSVRRYVTPITGEEAGRIILLDLAKWADNVKKGFPAEAGRKSSKKLSDMLYGLQSNDDVAIYNEYRVIQDQLHQWWVSAEKTNREARIDWLKAARELEFIALAAVHDDPMLGDFKPEAFLECETLSSRFDDLKKHARVNDAQCAIVGVLSDEFNMPELLSLQRPLSAFKPEEARALIDMTIERLNACTLKGAAELASHIAELPEPGVSDFIDQGVIRRAKAVMNQKKPFLVRLHNARNVLIGIDRI